MSKKGVKIDNLHLMKKLNKEYLVYFNKIYDMVVKDKKKNAADKNVIINIALEQCLNGQENKKKAQQVFPREIKEFIVKNSKGPVYKEMKRKLRNQDYEKFTITSFWVILMECIVLFFLKNILLAEVTDAYLVNYWVDLFVASMALLIGIRNYSLRVRIIQRYEFGNFYFRIDAIALALCIFVKLISKSNFDVTYLLLVIVFFVTKKKIKPQFEAVIE